MDTCNLYVYGIIRLFSLLNSDMMEKMIDKFNGSGSYTESRSVIELDGVLFVCRDRVMQ